MHPTPTLTPLGLLRGVPGRRSTSRRHASCLSVSRRIRSRTAAGVLQRQRRGHDRRRRSAYSSRKSQRRAGVGESDAAREVPQCPWDQAAAHRVGSAGTGSACDLRRLPYADQSWRFVSNAPGRTSRTQKRRAGYRNLHRLVVTHVECLGVRTCRFPVRLGAVSTTADAFRLLRSRRASRRSLPCPSASLIGNVPASRKIADACGVTVVRLHACTQSVDHWQLTPSNRCPALALHLSSRAHMGTCPEMRSSGQSSTPTTLRQNHARGWPWETRG